MSAKGILTSFPTGGKEANIEPKSVNRLLQKASTDKECINIITDDKQLQRN